MKKQVLHIGLDVHQNTIDVSVTNDRSYGKINITLDAINKLIEKLQTKTVEDEAIRDLVRYRDDMRRFEHKARLHKAASH